MAVGKILTFWAAPHSVDLHDFAGLKLTWMQLRDSNVSELRKLADNIDKHHKNVNITTVSTSSVSAAAGLVVLGTLFAPATFGLSTAAVGVGVAAGLTACGASLTEMGLTKSIFSTAQEYIDADDKLTSILFFFLKELNICNEELEVSVQKLADSLSDLRTMFAGIRGLGSTASLARGGAMMNPGLAKEMIKISEIKVVVAKFGFKASARGARSFSTVQAISTALAIGSVSAAGAALREKADLLEKQQKEIIYLIKKLQED